MAVYASRLAAESIKAPRFWLRVIAALLPRAKRSKGAFAASRLNWNSAMARRRTSEGHDGLEKSQPTENLGVLIVATIGEKVSGF
jgi:hypothetical protein